MTRVVPSIRYGDVLVTVVPKRGNFVVTYVASWNSME